MYVYSCMSLHTHMSAHGGQRTTWALKQGLSLALGSPRWPVTPQSYLSLTPTMLELQICATTLDFFFKCRFWGLNSGSSAYQPSTLPTAQSPVSFILVILTCMKIGVWDNARWYTQIKSLWKRVLSKLLFKWRLNWKKNGIKEPTCGTLSKWNKCYEFMSLSFPS